MENTYEQYISTYRSKYKYIHIHSHTTYKLKVQVKVQGVLVLVAEDVDSLQPQIQVTDKQTRFLLVFCYIERGILYLQYGEVNILVSLGITPSFT